MLAVLVKRCHELILFILICRMSFKTLLFKVPVVCVSSYCLVFLVLWSVTVMNVSNDRLPATTSLVDHHITSAAPHLAMFSRLAAV
jgi:hypothetical protein